MLVWWWSDTVQTSPHCGHLAYKSYFRLLTALKSGSFLLKQKDGKLERLNNSPQSLEMNEEDNKCSITCPSLRQPAIPPPLQAWTTAPLQTHPKSSSFLFPSPPQCGICQLIPRQRLELPPVLCGDYQPLLALVTAAAVLILYRGDCGSARRRWRLELLGEP
ncbi:hypothetical protein E2C01_069452 [Portunus trituberculatus]|uniref:Uncharacterized protein n=1 Tax=Portunus trituberculatus TaxID=210409 RepID=A0A5B7I285_PORTR|nr:hypothetical protein [Portunus trituberculatus]